MRRTQIDSGQLLVLSTQVENWQYLNAHLPIVNLAHILQLLRQAQCASADLEREVSIVRTYLIQQ